MTAGGKPYAAAAATAFEAAAQFTQAARFTVAAIREAFVMLEGDGNFWWDQQACYLLLSYFRWLARFTHSPGADCFSSVCWRITRK